MKYHLHREQQLNCTLETAWAFFTIARNIFKITPQEMNFKLLSSLGEEEAIYEGMHIEYSVSPLFKIPLRWTTAITQVTHPYRFTDVQKKGPYKRWHHTHEFIPNENGVLMKDVVIYELPLGVLGDLTHHLLVRKKIESLFDYRHQTIEKLFQVK